jgi:hypothetical protein
MAAIEMTTNSVLSGAVGSSQSRPLVISSGQDQLLQQATALAGQIQLARRNLVTYGPAAGRPALKALEQQLVQVWSAIRAVRSSGGNAADARRQLLSGTDAGSKLLDA